MHLFAPLRPRLANGLPAILGLRTAVPALTLSPNPDQTCQISVQLPNADSSAYSQHIINIPSEQISFILAFWINDPEAAMQNIFGWKFPKLDTKQKSGQKAETKVSAPDATNHQDLI